MGAAKIMNNNNNGSSLSDENSNKKSQQKQGVLQKFSRMKITISIGAILLFTQFLISRWEGRIERSLEHAENYRILQEASLYIDNYWVEVIQNEAKVGQNKGRLASIEDIPRSLASLSEQASEVLKKNQDYRSKFSMLKIFFNEIAICANERYCDAFTACSHFMGPVYNFIDLHKKDIVELEYFKYQFMSDFGGGVEIMRFYNRTCAPYGKIRWYSKPLWSISGFFNMLPPI